MTLITLTVALIHSVCLYYIGITQLSVRCTTISPFWNNCIVSSVTRKRVVWIMHDRIEVVGFSIVVGLFGDFIKVISKAYNKRNYR